MTASSKPLQSSFETANARLAARSDALLRQCAASRPLFARLLNTLSLLEHMGARRIMATQSGTGTEEETLRHIAEEARHAFFFRRHAGKAAGNRLGYDDRDLMAPASARLYFRRLDAIVTRAVAGMDARIPYLYMSMIVEFRALWLYRLFEGAQTAVSLRSVLGEEAAHLDQMAGRLDAIGRFDESLAARLSERETALYERLLAAMERAAIPA
jgi:hypothetical protein